MNFVPFLFFILAAVANGTGSALTKYAAIYKAAPNSSNVIYVIIFAAAMLLFGGSFPFYAYGLSKIKLSIAQPVFSVVTYFSVALISLFVFKEPYSLMKISGLVLIIIGVIMVANS